MPRKNKWPENILPANIWNYDLLLSLRGERKRRNRVSRGRNWPRKPHSVNLKKIARTSSLHDTARKERGVPTGFAGLRGMTIDEAKKRKSPPISGGGKPKAKLGVVSMG